VPDGAESCPACGAPTASGPANEGGAAGSVVTGRRVAYAGFWRRAVAYLMDWIFVQVVAALTFIKPMLDHAGISTKDPWALMSNTSRQMLAINLAGLMASWLYWALMESSAWQATLGKRMVGIRVTDLQGQRISLARASGRFFGKILSALSLFFGFAMAGFTEKKQAMHDLLAGTLVVRGF
jgi:uncharacterized RDD family membrane protein YckC